MSTDLIPFNDLQKMAQAITRSQLFGIQNIDQAVALMCIAQAEGRHPASVAREYDIIKGKPALKADAMLSRFIETGGKIDWLELNDSICKATFTHPKGGSATIDWDIDRAKKAELLHKDNWKKFPRQMLRARTISEGIRTVYPTVILGIYERDEVEEFDVVKKPAEKEVNSEMTSQNNDHFRSPVEEQEQKRVEKYNQERSWLFSQIKKCDWKPEELKELAEMEIGKPSSEMSNEELEEMFKITRSYQTLEEYVSAAAEQSLS